MEKRVFVRDEFQNYNEMFKQLEKIERNVKHLNTKELELYLNKNILFSNFPYFLLFEDKYESLFDFRSNLEKMIINQYMLFILRSSPTGIIHCFCFKDKSDAMLGKLVTRK